MYYYFDKGEVQTDFSISFGFTFYLNDQLKNVAYVGLVGSTASPDTSRRTFVAAAVGSGSLLLLLVIIIVACVINRKKLKGVCSVIRPIVY